MLCQKWRQECSGRGGNQFALIEHRPVYRILPDGTIQLVGDGVALWKALDFSGMSCALVLLICRDNRASTNRVRWNIGTRYSARSTCQSFFCNARMRPVHDADPVRASSSLSLRNYTVVEHCVCHAHQPPQFFLQVLGDAFLDCRLAEQVARLAHFVLPFAQQRQPLPQVRTRIA